MKSKIKYAEERVKKSYDELKNSKTEDKKYYKFMSDTNNKSVCFLIDYAFPITSNQYLGKNHEAKVCMDRSMPYFILEADLINSSSMIPDNEEAVRILKSHKLTAYNNADMKDGLVFPRAFCGYERAISNLIKEYGANPAIDKDDIETIDNWPNHLAPEFLKRNIEIIHASDLEKRVKEFASPFGRKVFLKTKTKSPNGYGRVSRVKEALRSLEDGLPVSYNFLHPEWKPRYLNILPSTELIISEPLKIEKDRSGNVEYRTWVAQGEVAVTKRHSNETEEIPKNIQDFTKSFVLRHKGKLPTYYSMDIGMSKKKGLFVIELNQMSSYAWSGEAGPTEDIFDKILDKFLAPKI